MMSRWIRSLAILLLFVPGAVRSQEEPKNAPAKVSVPRYAPPKGYYVALDVAGVEPMKTAFASTAIGKFIEDEAVKKVIDLVKGRLEKRTEAIEAMRQLAAEVGVEKSLAEEVLGLLEEKVAETYPERMRLFLYPLGDDREEVSIVASLVFREQDVPAVRTALGAFIDLLTEKKHIRKSKEAATLATLEVHAFDVLGDGPGDATGNQFEDIWYFIDGNELHVGVDARSQLARMEVKADPEIASAVARVTGGGTGIGTVVIDLETILRDQRQAGDAEDWKRADRILEALGLGNLTRVVVGVSMMGEHFRETFLLERAEGAQGMLQALRSPPAEGAGAIPPLPAPAPVLMKFGGSVDVGKITSTIIELATEFGDYEADRTAEVLGVTPVEMVKAFGGGFAFSVSAPEAFSLIPIPRLAAVVDIADDEMFSKLLALAREKLENIGFSESEHEGVSITTVTIPNNPSSLVPTYARVGKAFYLADAPSTMKALIDTLKEKKAVKETHAPVAVSWPEGFTDPTLRISYDPGEIYATVFTKYMPLLQLGFGQILRQSGRRQEPLLAVTELPAVGTFRKYFRGGEAIVTWGPGGLYVSSSSAVGNPLNALAASLYLPLGGLVGGLALDAQQATLEREVLHKRVVTLREALRLYRTSFGGGRRYPTNLGELLKRGLLDDADVLIVPTDAAPAAVEYQDEDGEIQNLQLSYKYLPDSKLTVKVSDLTGWGLSGPSIPGLLFASGLAGNLLDRGDEKDTETDRTILLYELNANAHDGRMVLTVGGSIYHLPEDTFKRVVSLQD